MIIFSMCRAFFYFAIISPWRRPLPFTWTNLNHYPHRKFIPNNVKLTLWFWRSKKCKTIQTGIRWSEKLSYVNLCKMLVNQIWKIFCNSIKHPNSSLLMTRGLFYWRTYDYSKTCYGRPPLRPSKSGLARQVVSHDRGTHFINSLKKSDM
jgi:hypothetical protein